MAILTSKGRLNINNSISLTDALAPSGTVLDGPVSRTNDIETTRRAVECIRRLRRIRTYSLA